MDPVRLTPFFTFLFKRWTGSLRYRPDGPWWFDMEERNRRGEPVILALWHHDLFGLAGWGRTRPGMRYVSLISQSKDGEIIARIVEGCGHATARGSSTRGGLKALLMAKRIMEKENRACVFTVDGPKGPRHQVKDGVLFLAHRAKAPIYPVRGFPRHRKVFDRAWDRFELPMPFTRYVVRTGEPLFIQAEELDQSTLAQERKRLEQAFEALG